MALRATKGKEDARSSGAGALAGPPAVGRQGFRVFNERSLSIGNRAWQATSATIGASKDSVD